MTSKMLYKTLRNYITVAVYLVLLGMAVSIAPKGIMAQDQAGGVLSAIIENNVVTGNTAGSGGGIACSNSSPIIRNNLLIGNSVTGKNGIEHAGLNDGLVAYWSFNNCDARDDSGNGYDGVLHGNLECVQGIQGNALKFHGGGSWDASGDHVLIPSIDFASMSEFSVCLWVNEEGDSPSDNGNEAYISFGDHHGGWLGIAHLWDNLEFSVGSKLATSVTPLSVPFDYSDRNKNIPYCLVYKGGSLKAYKNAVLLGEKTQYVDVANGNSALARHWWSNGSATSTRFIGTLDEVRIYNRALSEAEIRDLYTESDYGGGAIFVYGASSKPTVTGNTISKNNAGSGKGGGIYLEEGEATIVNCILWQNQDDLGNCTATYSDVTNLSANPGTGNISADPVFIQTTAPNASGYYRLAVNSPCINAGDPAYTPAPGETDIDGEPRVAGVRIDMGADEIGNIIPPDTQISTGPGEYGQVCVDSVTFGYTGSDDTTLVSLLQYAWRLDGTTWSEFSTATSQTLTNLSSGSHTFEVVAKDASGNIDPTPAIRHFIVDLDPPVFSNIVCLPSWSQATISWQTDEGSTSQVEYGPTVSYGLVTPLNTNLATNHNVSLTPLVTNTPYHYRVRSKDGCEHEKISEDQVFATLLDTGAPETQITSGPPEGGTSCSASVSICWTGADDATPTAQLLYSWKLDNADWSLFGSETCHLFTGLSEGSHTFQVRAHDSSGNIDATPAVRNFTADLSSPTLSNIIASVQTSQVTITWLTNKPATSQVEYGSTSEYGSATSLNTAAVVNHSVTITGLTPESVYHYRVRSKDACEREVVSSDRTLSTTADTEVPNTLITSGPADNGKACDTTVSMCWSGTDDATPTAELQYSYRLDSIDWSGWTSDTCQTFTALSEGLHTFWVRAKDTSGNVDATPAVRYFYVDTIMPALSNLSVVPRDYRAKVTWNTSEPTTSQVEYGETSAYGMASALDSTMTGAHTVTIAGLNPQTTYHYRVKSNDGCREIASQDATFTTTEILYPNLRVANIDMRGTCRSLERIDFKWLVRNDGPGSAEGSWADKVFLSSDQILGSEDTLLGEFTFSGGLDWGTERWQTATLDMPMMPAGTYHIIVKTDGNNVVNETNEDDNILIRRIDYLMIKQLTAAPDQIPIRLNPGETASGEIDLINLGDTPLTGIAANVEGNSSNISVQALPPSTLSGLTVQKVSYAVSASDESVIQNSPVLKFTSAEGKETAVTFNVTVNPRYPNLVTNPGYLETTMLRGSQTLVEFEVTNTGAVPANDLKVLLPVANWLSLVTPDNIGSLGPGGKIKVGLALKPTDDLPLGPYTGSIALSGNNVSAPVNFRFTAISDKIGGLKIIAQDEFTYFADDHPPVVDAAVKIKNPYDGTPVADGRTDVNGEFTKGDLFEGYYNIEVSANKHGTYNGNVLVVAGQTKEIKAFLPRQLVSYTWKVEPVQTEDKYVVTLEAVFETHVPAPVVTVEPTVLDLSKLEYDANGKATVNYTITNHGFIAANGTTIQFGTHPDYQITPLNENIGTVAAMSSMVIPVTVQKLTLGSLAVRSKAESNRVLRASTSSCTNCGARATVQKFTPESLGIRSKAHGNGVLSASSSSSGDCGVPVIVDYYYVCDGNRWQRVNVYAITGKCPPAETPNIPGPGPSGGGGAGGGGGGGFVNPPSPIGVTVEPCCEVTKDCTHRRQRPGYQITTDGCGPPIVGRLIPDNWYDADFHKTCDNHDRCFQNCGATLNQCNNDLCTGLFNDCFKAYGTNEGLFEQCLEFIARYCRVVDGMSEPFWRETQNKACCCDARK